MTLVLTVPGGTPAQHATLPAEGQQPVRATIAQLEGLPAGAFDGQLLFFDITSGTWVATPAGPSDGQIARWDAASGTWLFVDLPSIGAIEYFDDSYSPIARWNFNGTLNDAGGVAANNLTFSAGTASAFCDVVPGKLGVYVFVGDRYQTDAAVPGLQVLGDMTFLAIIQSDANPTAAQTLLTYCGPGETQPDNILYSLAFEPTASPPDQPRRLRTLHENGAGVNVQFVSTGPASLPPAHNISLVGFTRIGGVHQPYYNGRVFGGASGVLAAPDGGNGANTRLVLGASAPNTVCGFSFVVFAAQIINRGLTPAEVLDVYNRSLGPGFGIIT